MFVNSDEWIKEIWHKTPKEYFSVTEKYKRIKSVFLSKMYEIGGYTVE